MGSIHTKRLQTEKEAGNSHMAKILMDYSIDMLMKTNVYCLLSMPFKKIDWLAKVGVLRASHKIFLSLTGKFE
jgi:hypothetical protein